MAYKEFLVSPPLAGESHSHYALHNIKRNIFLCRLQPGDIINEAEIAERLSISRTPVHEAVLSLRDCRLIDVIPRKESRVSYINLEYVNEGLFFRCAVEAELLKNLAGNTSPDYLQRMRETLSKQEELFTSGVDLDDFYSLDDEFHSYLYLAANKPLILNIRENISAHLDRIRYLVRLENDLDIEETSLHEHRQFLQILSAGIDPDMDVNSFYKRHIQHFQKKLPYYVEKYEGYFTIGK